MNLKDKMNMDRMIQQAIEENKGLESTLNEINSKIPSMVEGGIIKSKLPEGFETIMPPSKIDISAELTKIAGEQLLKLLKEGNSEQNGALSGDQEN